MPDMMPQEKPLHELLSHTMVDIYVGPENTQWNLHEKLLCHHSPFFRKIFYKKGSTTKSFGLPEEENTTFRALVGWLYSSSLAVPREEADLTVLLDLYLLAEKLQMPHLAADILQVVREWYKYSDTYPGLRRVQYIYANTEEGSPMRHMLVHSVARLMVLEKGIAPHWEKALRKNGQLAVDIILAIQDWRLNEDVIPDSRDDPAEGEELIDVEAELDEAVAEAEAEIEGKTMPKKAASVVAIDDEAEAEAEEDEEEAVDDSEETVVDSPATTKKLRGHELASDFKKIALHTVPNGLSVNDYGTLA